MNVLSDETTTYPLAAYESDIRIGWPQQHRDRPCLRYIIDMGHENDVVGSISTLDELLEGPAWRNTSTGCRLPAAIETTPEGRRHEWDHDVNVWFKDDWEAAWPALGMDMWKLEKDAGRKQFSIKTTEGITELPKMESEKVARPSDEATGSVDDLQGGADEPESGVEPGTEFTQSEQE
jgi:hypothetical protein